MSSAIKDKKAAKCKTITSYFTPKGCNSVPLIPSTRCPMCHQPANIRDINRHLDNGCPKPEDFNENPCDNTIKMANDCDVLESNTYDNVVLPNEDKQYPCVNLPVENIIDDRLDTVSEIKYNSINNDEKTVNYRATRSISNTPTKVNTLKRLAIPPNTDSKETSIELTPPKIQTKLHLPSPTKQTQYAIKTLFPKKDTEHNPLINNKTTHHIPFTPSRRQDPLHVPYYLANFETVLRGVLEETEDGELFLPEEVRHVERFRSLNLQAKKLYVRLFQRKYAWLQVGLFFTIWLFCNRFLGCLILNALKCLFLSVNLCMNF